MCMSFQIESFLCCLQSPNCNTRDMEWAIYEDGEMYCSVCKAFKKKNTLTSGSTNFRTSTLVRHIESRDHRESVIARQSAQRMEMMIKKSFSKEDQSLIAALVICYSMLHNTVKYLLLSMYIIFC